MAAPARYDAIIIGSGQGGTPLARAFAEAKQKTALVEREHIGGCCINEGCTPTKTMIASGRIAELSRRGPDYGVHSVGQREKGNEVEVDMAKVRERKREIVTSFRTGSEKKLEQSGVDVLYGEASFVDSKTLKVAMIDGVEKLIEGQQIFINTGCQTSPSNIQGIEHVDTRRVLNSTSIQDLDNIPRHLVVVGGGYVGVEFGQLFRRLGAKVTILHRGRQLLSREDIEIAEMLLAILREQGVDVYLEATPTTISFVAGNGFGLSFSTQGNKTLEDVTHILFATGRPPNTGSLNLKAAGVETDNRGYIICNEYLQTSNPSIYALGDVKGLPAFTHVSYDDYRIITSSLIPAFPWGPKMSTKDRIIPYVVYTDPQLAHVGLHEHEAREKFPGKLIKTATMPMKYVARALETDETHGLMKAVVDGETGLILGFTCLGAEGGEVMSVVQTAMIGKLTYLELQNAMFAHPAFAESLNNLWAFLK